MENGMPEIALSLKNAVRKMDYFVLQVVNL